MVQEVIENCDFIRSRKEGEGVKIKKAFARMMTSIPTKAKPNELVAFSQPPFCNGGKHCGRDKSGL